MKTEKWFKDMLKSFEKDFDFRLETIILDITENISKRMKKKNINRTGLSNLLNVSPAAVTKILNGNSNFTLKTLLSIADALELDLNVSFKGKPSVVDSILIPFPSGRSLEAHTTATSGFSMIEEGEDLPIVQAY